MSKLQCVIYQWICLNELYKLLKSFFKFQISFLNFGQKTKNIQKNREVAMCIDQIAMCYISMDLSQQALQTNGKLFSNFKLVFKFFAENLEIFKRIAIAEPGY